MRLHYYHARQGNFGDDLNGWLWDRLLPAGWDAGDNTLLVGIGTILDRTIPSAQKTVVFGSGAGYQSPPRGFGGTTWQVLSVRGPLTAQILALPSAKAVTDGAALLAMLPECTPLPESERHGVVFMPHHYAMETGIWHEICVMAGVELIDPRSESRESIQRIRRARLVLADAMHAAIVADTLRVPWLPLVTSAEINTFKWVDWTRSLGLPYVPVILPPTSALESFRAMTLTFRGRNFAVAQPSTDALLADCARRWRKDQNVCHRTLCDINHGLFLLGTRLLMMASCNRQNTGLVAAAAIMEETTRKTPYLSNENTLRQKINQLADSLEYLRNQVR